MLSAHGHLQSDGCFVSLIELMRTEILWAKSQKIPKLCFFKVPKDFLRESILKGSSWIDPRLILHPNHNWQAEPDEEEPAENPADQMEVEAGLVESSDDEPEGEAEAEAPSHPPGDEVVPASNEAVQGSPVALDQEEFEEELPEVDQEIVPGEAQPEEEPKHLEDSGMAVVEAEEAEEFTPEDKKLPFEPLEPSPKKVKTHQFGPAESEIEKQIAAMQEKLSALRSYADSERLDLKFRFGILL